MVGMHSSTEIDSQVAVKSDNRQRSASDVTGNKEEHRTNLIVNYLPQSMSEDDIRSRFSSVGEIESCKLMKHKVTGQSLGYAFINYRRPVDAIKAINTLNGLTLQNKTIKVSFARPSSEAIVGANLYICGLPKHYTLRDLEDLFSPLGKIISSKILKGNMSQSATSNSTNNVLCISRGIGFIRYSLRTEAEKAIKVLNGTVPKGCTEPISVKFAHNPANTVNIFPPVPPRMVVGIPNRLGLPPGNMIPASTIPPHLANLLVRPKHPSVGNFRFNQMSVDFQVNSVYPGNIKNGLGWNLFVFNLPPETQENVLWQLFGPFGAVQSVKVIKDLQTNKCKGYGFVTMSNRDDAETAVRSLTGFSLGNQVTHVPFKTNKHKHT